jgi:hypothetical protein
MEDVLDLYHWPYHEARPLICIDEQPTQLVSVTRVPVPPRPGAPARYDYEYKLVSDRGGSAPAPTGGTAVAMFLVRSRIAPRKSLGHSQV